MTLGSSRLASGPGWRVDDIVCTAGPRDHPFEEKHDGMCIAAVTAGTFQYRSAQGSAVLAPGALLLGNDRQCFECGHEHGIGDRCLSFHFTPELMEAIAAEVPGVRRAAFAVARLPPLAALAPILAAVEAARDDGEGAEFEELALRPAGAVSAALRRIEEDAPEQLSLADLAREAAASPYHFLRIFRQVVGMTPHQFLLRARLHRAAVRLRRSGDTVLTIALESGFNDLSTFNRRFRRVMGRSPSAYRGRGETAAPR